MVPTCLISCIAFLNRYDWFMSLFWDYLTLWEANIIIFSEIILVDIQPTQSLLVS